MLKTLLLSLVAGFLVACSSLGGMAELAPDERGAACARVAASSVNPFVNGETKAAILEINTGDPTQVLTPSEIAAVAASMGCNP